MTMPLRQRQAHIVPLVAVFLLSHTACLAESEPEIETQAAAIFVSPTISRINSSTCAAVTVYFRALATIPRSYGLRRRKNGGMWTVVARGDHPATFLQDPHMLPYGDSYEYSVRAYYADGAGYWSAPVAVTPGSCPVRKSTSGPSYTVKVIPVTTIGRPAPLTVTQIHNIVFGDRLGSPSVADFLDEISGGWGHTDAVATMKIAGVVQPWVILNTDASHIETQRPTGHPAGQWPGGMGGWYQWTREHKRNYETGADIYVYVFNSIAQDGGLSTPPRVAVGTLLLDKPYGAIAHEIAHTVLKFPHSPSAVCGNGLPYPTTASVSDSHCLIGTSQNPSSFMSGHKGGAHPSAFWKSQVGFLAGQTTWVNASEEPEPGSELLPPGNTVTLDLYDSVSQQGRSARQLIALKLEADDTSFMIDYRRAVGLNATGGTNTIVPFVAGVYVQLKPGHDIGQDIATLQPTVLQADEFDPFTPLVATVGRPYRDAARGITVSVIANYGYMVRVRIERDAVVATKGCAASGCGDGPSDNCRVSNTLPGYCDDLCTGYGDCCDDYQRVCY